MRQRLDRANRKVQDILRQREALHRRSQVKAACVLFQRFWTD